MSEANRALALRWFEEVWNKGRESAVDELASPRLRCFGFPEPDSAIDADGFKAAVRTLQRSFSGIHISVDEMVSQENSVAVRWTARAAHTGTGLGFAATGLPVTIPGIAILHIRDGRIYEGWNAYDLTSVVHRLSTVAAAKRSEPRGAAAARAGEFHARGKPQ